MCIRDRWTENLIGGLAMHLVGPFPLLLAFHVFVVVVGTLILSGAVNTAIVGSNGVLNRVSEDGVLTDWFRHPHRKFGTSHRIINMVVIGQILTIVVSRGAVSYTHLDVYKRQSRRRTEWSRFQPMAWLIPIFTSIPPTQMAGRSGFS